MKHNKLTIAAALFGSILTAAAQLTIPSDGSDGAFNPSANVEIDLGLAATSTWNSPGTGNGIYDAEKWAVVYKFSSVNIPAGVKVTFKNHPSYAPVVWLVQGSVTIAGELNLNGKPSPIDTVGRLVPPEPGPGGFRGGATGPSSKGSGFGPGAGDTGSYSRIYGNPQILPLIGGSGADADYFQSTGDSGGGGGAILIACANLIQLSGSIFADGAPTTGFWGGGGAGGAVKLIADQVLGNGQISARNSKDPAGNGRTRIETNELAPSVRTTPETIGVPPANPPILWPAENAPKARVISVDAVVAPTDPNAPLVASADVAIQNNAPVNILIETQDFPIEGGVQLFISPKFAARITLPATRISGDINLATWRVTTTLPQGFVTLQARATQP